MPQGRRESAANSSRQREVISSTCSGRNNFPAEETIWESCEDALKRSPASVGCIDQQWSSVMSAILGIIYREFCKARLAEMCQVDGY